MKRVYEQPRETLIRPGGMRTVDLPVSLAMSGRLVDILKSSDAGVGHVKS